MTIELSNWLTSLKQELEPHFKPALLGRSHTVFNFCFDDGEDFHLDVTMEQFTFAPGRHNSPTLSLFVSNHPTLKDLLSGRADGMSAFMTGKYRADGNIVLSQLLLYMFMSDSPTIGYEVQE